MATATMEPIDRVLNALRYEGARDNKKYDCTCPAHEDDRESLSITESNNGAVLVHCFAGCKTERVVAALGLKMADLFAESSTKPKKSKLGSIVAVYDYTDATGKLLYQATRHDPKDFRQRRPDGKNGWTWNLKGVELVPYDLPRLSQATPDDWVFIVEGEKDVENLHSCGADIIATCNPMGAGKWRESYSQYFKGLKVCIFPDNDEPGRQHAQDVAKSLAGIVAEVRILELPGLPAKGDVSDWLAPALTAIPVDGGEALETRTAKLWELVDKAPKYIAPLPTTPTAHTNGNGAGAHDTHTASVEPPSTLHKRDLATLGYSFALNVLDDVIEVNDTRLDDGLAAVIRMQIRDLGHKNMGAVEDTYTALAYENRYHPVRRYLDGLTWEGTDQFRRLCSYVKDKHKPIVYKSKGAIVYTTPVFKVWLYRWMLAAVAKAYERQVQGPVLVLDGKQGVGKSRLAAFLGSALPAMFIESPMHPDNTDHDRYLATPWIWEIAELGATTRRADREALKAFITKDDVTFRKPYGHHPIQKSALANFIGTINDEAGFLTDPTGNRRFLTVTLESIDWQYENAVDVHQLWAQIVADYRQGQRWELLPAEQATRDGMNTSYERPDPVEERIVQCFDIDRENKLWFMFTTEIADHLRLMGARDAEQTLYNGIGSAMRHLGLTKSEKKVGGQRARGYYGIQKKG